MKRFLETCGGAKCLEYLLNVKKIVQKMEMLLKKKVYPVIQNIYKTKCNTYQYK